ncbi:MAG: hypothetical protein N3F05_02345 [Candidatus Diapherotrites archaeon]|nr:hypothetical protein [Candidatus Diapherotrites archaeon]
MRDKRPELSDEEIALRIIKLYFEEIARIGIKRNFTLDSILNAYFYTLHKLKNKKSEIARVCKMVQEELTEQSTKGQNT